MRETANCYRTAGLGLILSLSSVVLTQAESADSPTANTADTTGLEEVVVTGSLIRGKEAAGSKVIVVSGDIQPEAYQRVMTLGAPPR